MRRAVIKVTNAINLRRAIFACLFGPLLLASCARGGESLATAAGYQTEGSTAPTGPSAAITTGVVKLTGPLGDMPYQYVGSVLKEQIWGNTLIVDPVPAGTVGKLQPADLVALCDTEASCGQNEEGPVISLGLITTPSSGEAGPNGALIPDMSKAVGYELVWQHQVCMPNRLAATVTNGDSPATTPPSNCTKIAVFDGLTGKYVLSVLL